MHLECPKIMLLSLFGQIHLKNQLVCVILNDTWWTVIPNCSIMRGLFYHIPSNVSLFRRIKSLSIVSSLFSECCESYAWIKTKLHPTIAPTIVSVIQSRQDIRKRVFSCARILVHWYFFLAGGHHHPPVNEHWTGCQFSCQDSIVKKAINSGVGTLHQCPALLRFAPNNKS